MNNGKKENTKEEYKVNEEEIIDFLDEKIDGSDHNERQ